MQFILNATLHDSIGEQPLHGNKGPKIIIGIGSLLWHKLIHRYDKTKPKRCGPVVVIKVLYRVSLKLRLLFTISVTQHISTGLSIITLLMNSCSLFLETDPILQDIPFSNTIPELCRYDADEPDVLAVPGP